MAYLSELRHAISSVLVKEETAHSLTSACIRVGIVENEEETYQYSSLSKEKFVLALLNKKTQSDLLEISKNLIREYASAANNEVISRAIEPSKLSEITKINLVEEFLVIGLWKLRGKLDFVEFLNRTWPLEKMESTDGRFTNARGDIWQHMVNNEDWDESYLLRTYLGLTTASDKTFFTFLEQVVHPIVRDTNEQNEYVSTINKHLQKDGFRLEIAETISGYPIYKVLPNKIGNSGKVKNLIFAANGPKPEIILSDAMENEITIIKNGEYCLVYDQPIPETGLSWLHLLQWWAGLTKSSPESIETERELYRRLFVSLASEPEKLFFKTYFETFSPHRTKGLPALIPQVYLHYDPYTLKQLHGEKRLPRQRMDFLFLFSNRDRIVIEIDGKQHYSEDDGKVNPAKYAELVSADRQLQLDGYEVYRFGGQEFVEQAKVERTITDFFEQLFRKYRILQ